MDHVLTQCIATPTRMIWNLARNTWPHDPQLWPEISIGTIMGWGKPTPKTRTKRATRLLHILLSESAHLIRVLRRERVIRDQTHTPSEIRNRWLRSINMRLTDDRITALKIKQDKQSLQKNKRHLEHVLKKQRDLPHDWIASREVL
ncbi:hypothetical protein BGY98DRAFT_1045097, partial [Russula aff. rugulosa BPL654]